MQKTTASTRAIRSRTRVFLRKTWMRARMRWAVPRPNGAANARAQGQATMSTEAKDSKARAPCPAMSQEMAAPAATRMTNRVKRSVEGETKDRLFAELIARYAFAVPESLVQEQIDARLERGLRALAAQGMNTEQMRKLDFGRLRAAQRDAALAEVKTNLLLDRIADQEKIGISDEELDRELQLAALQSREPIDALRSRLTADGGMVRIREQLRREKTASLMYERLP